MTMIRRLDRYRDGFSLIVVDEAHHAVAASWAEILAAYPDASVLGVTATPERKDGRGLGEFFDPMVIGPSVAELIKLNFLAPSVIYGPDREIDLTGTRTIASDYDQAAFQARMMTKGLVGDDVEHYRKHAAGAPGIAFCVGVNHSLAVAESFVMAGYRARHVDGETPAEERQAAMAALASGEINIISNCSLISEGFDAPAVGALIMLRPTQSLALYLQMVGSALRPSPGKQRAVILDHAGNVHRHGLPDQDRLWSLEASKRQKQTANAPVKACPECGAITSSAARECPECGFEFGGRKINRVVGELVDIRADPAALAAWPHRKAVNRDPDKLRRVARARGNKMGWVHYQMLPPKNAELAGSSA